MRITQRKMITFKNREKKREKTKKKKNDSDKPRIPSNPTGATNCLCAMHMDKNQVWENNHFVSRKF